MAELHIERKKTSVGVGLAALLLLALIVWAALEYHDRHYAEAAVPAAAALPIAAAPAGSAVPSLVLVDPAVPIPATAAYLAHVRGAGEARLGSDHRYTAEAVVHMATALREIAQARPGLHSGAVRQAESLYALAAGLVASPDSLRMHGDWMRQAALSASAVVEGLADDVKGPVPEVREQAGEARRAAVKIEATTPLLAQQEAVRAFLAEMGDALAMLARPGPAAAS